jgi:hypothetical protein
MHIFNIIIFLYYIIFLFYLFFLQNTSLLYRVKYSLFVRWEILTTFKQQKPTIRQDGLYSHIGRDYNQVIFIARYEWSWW